MLAVDDLTIQHPIGSTPSIIVSGISFTLERGDSLGIVGESGSGKTITALSLLRLLPYGMKISAGQICYTPENGKTVNLAELALKEMRTFRGKVIAMIFQEPMSSLNPSMRCGEQIAEAVKLHLKLNNRKVVDRTMALLEEVDLPSSRLFYNKYPHQLSGGQRQRIMIAMALAGDPEILVADEPTTALDVTVQKKILELLKQIRLKRRMSLIFISHDLGVIRSVCDRALVMYKGKIVESGDTAELFDNPQHPYTRGLLACRPQLASVHDRLPTMADFLDDREIGTSGKKIKKTRRPKSSTKPDPEESLPSLLEVQDLQTSYTIRRNILGKARISLHAVDHVSFSIRPGETLGLIGESGCGKSTLGRSIIRLVRSREGNILFRGESVNNIRGRRLNEYRRNVQFIFQDPYSSLNPGIRVGRVLTEVMRVHGLHGGKTRREEAAIALLDKVGLTADHFQRYPHEFSGGQRQRIGIARALATHPKLIICDESVSSLDVSVQAQILNLLNELKDAFGLTYLFISHDLAVVKYMADRIMVMRDGKLLETADTEDLFNHPATDYTRELIASIPS